MPTIRPIPRPGRSPFRALRSALIALFAIACALGSPEPEVALTPEDLLDRLEALGALAPFSGVAVGTALGAPLPVKSDSDYYRLYEAPAPGFAKVTVMEPKAGASNGGSVALQVPGAPCVTMDLARARFGTANKVPTHPGAPPRPLDVWTHSQPWGDLLLAYDPATGCLAEATLRAK